MLILCHLEHSFSTRNSVAKFIAPDLQIKKI